MNLKIKKSSLFRCNSTLYILLAFILLTSCAALYSKDDYIQAFGDFIVETDENGASYTAGDWEKADQTYHQYAEVEYKRFKSKFNELDSPAVSKLKVIYMVLRYNSKANQGEKK